MASASFSLVPNLGVLGSAVTGPAVLLGLSIDLATFSEGKVLIDTCCSLAD
jgi:hypothetical protein